MSLGRNIPFNLMLGLNRHLTERVLEPECRG